MKPALVTFRRTLPVSAREKVGTSARIANAKDAETNLRVRGTVNINGLLIDGRCLVAFRRGPDH
jgi:hypothetical protein